MKKQNRFFSIFFVFILFCPFILYRLFFSRMPIENNENRSYAEKPKISVQNYLSFPKLYDAYVNDSFALRSKLIRAYSIANYALFHRYDDSEVIIGKENWLFLKKSKNDYGKPVMNYKGLDGISEDSFSQIVTTLNTFQNRLKAENRDFYFLIAPDKEQIYSEYMPDYIRRVQIQSQGGILSARLQESTDIPVIFPQTALVNAKRTAPVYYQLDSHWNNWGAMIAVNELLSVIGVPRISEENYHLIRLNSNTKENNTPNPQGYELPKNDLASLINLSDWLHEENDLQISYTDAVSTNKTMIDGSWLYSQTLSTSTNSQCILIIGDSFSNAMLPILAHRFSTVYFMHRDSVYSWEKLQQIDPDIVVLQTAEKYIDILPNFNFGNE